MGKHTEWAGPIFDGHVCSLGGIIHIWRWENVRSTAATARGSSLSACVPLTTSGIADMATRPSGSAARRAGAPLKGVRGRPAMSGTARCTHAVRIAMAGTPAARSQSVDGQPRSATAIRSRPAMYASRLDTSTHGHMHPDGSLSTSSSWRKSSVAAYCLAKTSTTSTGAGMTTARRTSNCGSPCNPQGSARATCSRGRRR